MEQWMKNFKKNGMTLKELKDLLNAHNALDDKKVRVCIEGPNISAPLVSVDFDFDYTTHQLVVYFEAIDEDIDEEELDCVEIQENYLDASEEDNENDGCFF